MRLTPREPVIPDVGGFTPENDIFGYRDFADRLANLVGNFDEPLVIALDSPWGSGKTIFIKQWAGLLRERGTAAIYFDSFANDHYEDAFVALSAEILVAANAELDEDERVTSQYVDKAKKVGAMFAPLATRVATRVVTAGVLGLDDVKAGGEAVEELIKALGDESGQAVEKAISETISNASEERVALEVFRKSLSEIAAKLTEQNNEANQNYPLVFIVDELDRCRPPFALSIIEQIKHLFSVPGVCFVLVTNLTQLEQAVQGAYGTTFDAKTYLEKFYHLRITLPDDKDQQTKHRSAYLDYLWNELGINFHKHGQNESVKNQIVTLAEVHGLSLRKIERIMTHVVLACAAAGPRQMLIPPILAGLCVMRLTHRELYNAALAKSADWIDVENFLQPVEGQAVQDEWVLDWWKYAAGGSLGEEKANGFAESLTRYNVFDRKDIIPFTANYIEDLLQRVQVSDNQ